MSRMARAVVIVGLALASSACLPVLSPIEFEGSAPTFRPQRFFDGETASTGVLETRSGQPSRRFQVQGLGRLSPDGSFRLDQTISFEGEKPRKRTWLLRRIDEHRYTATLTDAVGPVLGEAYGNLFHVAYRMKSPVGGRMEQWLYLQPDGRTVVNEASIRVLGFTAAHLSERITRTGQAISP